MSAPGASLLLALLLAGDLAFIVLHLINKVYPFPNATLYHVATDGGYPEFYQYMKWLWIVLLLCYVLWRTKSANYLAWVLVFLYFLLDDSLCIHEKAGRYLAGHLHFSSALNLRGVDFGELIVSGVSGVVLLGLLAWAFLRGSRVFRKVSYDLTLLVVALVLCGVVVDMAHQALRFGRLVGFVFGFIEDAGEMLVASVMVWYVLLIAVRGGLPGLFLCDLLRRADARPATD